MALKNICFSRWLIFMFSVSNPPKQLQIHFRSKRKPKMKIYLNRFIQLNRCGLTSNFCGCVVFTALIYTHLNRIGILVLCIYSYWRFQWRTIMNWSAQFWNNYSSSISLLWSFNQDQSISCKNITLDWINNWAWNTSNL